MLHVICFKSVGVWEKNEVVYPLKLDFVATIYTLHGFINLFGSKQPGHYTAIVKKGEAVMIVCYMLQSEVHKYKSYVYIIYVVLSWDEVWVGGWLRACVRACVRACMRVCVCV